MADLRAEALEILARVPEDKLFAAVEALKFLARTTDPFWSNANQQHLSESIAEFDAGKVQEHELIYD